jgi:nucleotide-binding universal stress UspA family protein
MIHSKHWLACLDLTQMDNVLIGYSAFLSTVVKPETITFFHVIQSGPTTREIIEEFPEIESKEEFEKLIRNEMKEKIDSHFSDTGIEIRIVIKEGRPTDQIIDVVNSLEPDLLLVGKKVGYAGEGIIPKRILKYVASSVLFIPENCRYSLNHILVPTDFSELSAVAIKTANLLLQNGKGKVTAQHVYRYRAQFFPYILSPEDKQKVDSEMVQKKEQFIRDYNIPSETNFAITLHKDGKVANTIYNQAISDRSDLIIIGSRSKKIGGMIHQDFTDKMIDYAFGIPLLVQKNKEKHQKILKALFGS